MICDILLIEDDNFVISGEVAIVDFKNVTKSHLLQLDPLLVKKLAVGVNESFSCLLVFGSF
jgi:hypothetical protein